MSNLKDHPDYAKLNDQEKETMDKIEKSIEGKSQAAKDKLGAYVAMVAVIKSTSPIEMKKDVVKNIIDMIFDSGQLNTLNGLVTQHRLTGKLPPIEVIGIGLLGVNSNITKSALRVYNLVEALEMKEKEG